MFVPTLVDGAIGLRPIRLRDSKALENELIANRGWLRKWEATSPNAPMSFDTRASIRSLQQNARAGFGLPFVIEYEGQLAGQLNVSSISYGSVSSATIGYWVAERFAGLNITPTVVALAADHCFYSVGLHRIEICIRPENGPSLRVVEKLGFRYEGLRRRYIHINGDWRDHFCFGLVGEELPVGVLRRWKEGQVPLGQGSIPEVDRLEALKPISTRNR
ncbi:GNAT family N-acetyltransferase [Subtercola boreus]|uniref:GNAT family N-acetyltransferase n=1 Tax=Subtercola boreus TaxID=120213 RepID=A0A3E0W7W5_9MICO|nr:GNAT family protein [Subtercola boreus]RFA19284.1 GNAT family N-acetyltransferase [Subtercola boreus]RFA19544.1 GNAT family N-acetyltransferase [Subtercola boreus]RFA25910.1 GNAT family N-acetyltransferase [Subtercola boreus]